MAALLPALLMAENALRTSLPTTRSLESLQAHVDALWAIQDLIRQISQSN